MPKFVSPVSSFSIGFQIAVDPNPTADPRYRIIPLYNHLAKFHYQFGWQSHELPYFETVHVDRQRHIQHKANKAGCTRHSLPAAKRYSEACLNPHHVFVWSQQIFDVELSVVKMAKFDGKHALSLLLHGLVDTNSNRNESTPVDWKSRIV